MARLPVPGSDSDAWASILNEYLTVAHDSDGTQKTDSVGSAALRSRSIGIRHLRTTNASNSPLSDLILSNNGNDLVWKTAAAIAQSAARLNVNVADFGALGDGVTDDTDAIQAAIDAAAGGGQVVFPRGVFMIRGLKLRAQGTVLLGAARFGTRLTRLSGTQPLIDMSGTSSLNGHIKYCSLLNIMISGNSLPGVLLRSYYADNCVFREVNFIHCAGNATDIVEVWDTQFEACAWEDCGSTSEPALLMRNSMPFGAFGYSGDNTNQVHFHNCRWEGFRNGAVRLDGAANGSAALLNGIFFVSCKMESRFAAGSPFQIMMGSTIVFVNQLYIAIMAPDAGYTTPIDAIEDHGTFIFMTDVYVQWGSAAGLANSLIHIWRSGPHMYHEIGSYFPVEDPATAVTVAEPGCTDVMMSCLITNRGRGFIGDVNNMLEGGPAMGYTLPIDNTGTLRVTSSLTNKDLIKVDNNTTRPAFQVAGAVDTVGFSDQYVSEKWRVIGATGAARFASGKFQIEGTKGYTGINTTPVTSIALLIKAAVDGDKGIAVVRPSSTATNRLMEFQDETFNLQGMSIDSHGRPVAVGTPPRVTAGTQVTYANPGLQVRDIAGNITAAVKPSPTAPGSIASVTFSRAYLATPLSITLSDNSTVSGALYISARSATGFTVSTRAALQGGTLLNFDYAVIA